MSKKIGKESADDGSPPTAVDFIFRTMIARAGAPGKRQIRPKNVEDLLNADIQELGSDEDPDFDVSKDKHHDESDVSIESDEEDSNKKSEDDKRSMDGNVESDDEDDDDYNGSNSPNLTSDESDGDDSSATENSEEEEEDSQSPVQKRSALRETLQKLNDAEFTPHQNRKRKRPRKAGAAASSSKSKSGVKKEDASLSTSKRSTKAVAKGKEEKKHTGRASSSKRKPVELPEKSKGRNKNKKRKKSQDQRSIIEMVNSMEKKHQENRKNISVGSPICSACLGKSSDEMNEIVECDSCGITVHEACYGVSDTLSVSSGTGSSCSTEPWFCDACRTGAKQIFCELCPMQNGLYKETTAGRWIHLVCALYTPGVVITESGLPSLFEIPYAKWGAHACSLCEDSRLIRTGICIPCDAGMCKTYLHATCAQKHGLLSDPVPQGAELEADPFYAACKLHTNRETSKRRAKCYSILQEQLRLKQEQKLSTDITAEERDNQNRIKRKLERIRFKVAVKQAHNTIQIPNSTDTTKQDFAPLTSNNVNALSDQFPPYPAAPEILPQSWKDGVKKARYLHTSAGVTIAFQRKAMLMGLDLKALELEDKHMRIVSSVKKKWNVPPALNVEYSAYYADRENRITTLNSQCEILEKENEQLNNKQMDLQDSYDREFVHNELMSEDTESMRTDLVGMTTILKTLCSPGNKKLLSSIQTLESRTEIPGTNRRRSPSHPQRRLSPSKSENAKATKNSPSSLSPATSSPSERLAIKVCSACDRSDQQPWIIRCDNCKKFYHLKCLDPPLTRLPKRSRQCGWMCSDCGEEEFDAEEAEVDTEAPRTLRGRTKIRKPGKYRHSTDSRDGDLKIVCDGIIDPNRPETQMLKVEHPLASLALLTNGGIGSRKRKSDSSSNTPSLVSPSLLHAQSLLASPEIDGPPSKRQRRPTPKKINNDDEKKSKSTRVKKPSEIKVEPLGVDSDRDEAEDQDITDTEELPTKKPKMRPAKRIRKSTSDSGKTSKSSKSRPAKKQTVDSNDSVEGNDSGSTKTKKKRPSKAKTIEIGDNSKSPPRSTKKSRKSLAELQKIIKQKKDIIIGSFMAAAAAAEVKKSEDGSPIIPNGRTKLIKRRKSSSSSLLSIAANSSTTVPGEKDKSIPPKKRKRVSAPTAPLAPRDDSHENAIIDAVASGSLASEDNQRNGISRPQLPDGVLMQGMAPAKSGWNNNSSEDEHSIMKGHAMAPNCSNSELVTVNASDLLDCVLNSPSAPTTTISSYSPGFYSSSTSSNTTSVDTNTATKYVTSAISSPNSDCNNKSSTVSVPIWNQTQQQPAQDSQQNVIKLIYDTSEVAPVIRPLVPYTSPIPPPSIISPFINAVTNSLSLTSSEPCGKCFTCNKEELKKNMVTCDKCAQECHFMCLTPPLKYSPRRRNYAWYCSTCDENEGAQGGHLKHPHQSQHHQEAPSSTPANSTASAPLPQSSHLTVHLFKDDSMKNLFKKFKQ